MEERTKRMFDGVFGQTILRFNNTNNLTDWNYGEPFHFIGDHNGSCTSNFPVI